ncbi:MAG: hypothetical protein CL693_11205 [Cellvibrionaceae bacterium]|nr:hypothetical protein [Cellvibrionaceae bacterium]|tara:strand:- start:45 stop:440 length:396 start_codon:yes stop_codon:yes gene_type:complete
MRCGALFSLIAIVFSSGCELISITEDVSYRSSDRAVPSKTIDQIEVGQTNRLWLEKHLGPASTIKESDETLTYTYRFSEQVQQRVRIFLLFQQRSTDTRERLLFVELKDDLVQKLWLDGEEENLLEALTPG